MNYYLYGFLTGYLRKTAAEDEGFEEPEELEEAEGGLSGALNEMGDEEIEDAAEENLMSETPDDVDPETHRQAYNEIHGIMPKEARDRRAFVQPTEQSGPIEGTSEHDQGLQSTGNEDTNPVREAVDEGDGSLSAVHRPLDPRNTTSSGPAGSFGIASGENES